MLFLECCHKLRALIKNQIGTSRLRARPSSCPTRAAGSPSWTSARRGTCPWDQARGILYSRTIVYVHIYMYLFCTETYIHTYVYIHMYIYMYICIYMYIYMCICSYVYIYICICMYIYTHICIWIWIYTYIDIDIVSVYIYIRMYTSRYRYR